MCAARSETIHESTAGAYLPDLLDELIPLMNASHADVLRYEVGIPMRYAECFAILEHGRRVEFRDKRMFVGRIGHHPCESLLFESKGLHIMLDMCPEGAHGPVRDMHIKKVSIPHPDPLPGMVQRVRRFIGIDGSQVLLPVA